LRAMTDATSESAALHNVRSVRRGNEPSRGRRA
jgi:hypothetical protein